MKGLLLKELLMFKKMIIVITIFIAALILSGVFSGEPSIILMLPIFLSIWSFSFQGMDEVSHWKQYSVALPYERKTIVSAKYLSILLLDAVSMLIVAVGYLIAVAVGKVEFSADMLAIFMVMSVIMGLVFPMIVLPLHYKFNTEKARLLVMCIAGVTGGMSVTGIKVAGVISGGIAEYLPLIIVLAVAVLFVLSWLLSIKIYEKKDL